MPAVADEIHVRVVHLVRRQRGLEALLRLRRARHRRHEREARRDPVHVRIDREVGPIEREEEHAGRGLRPDAGEPNEEVEETIVADAARAWKPKW